MGRILLLSSLWLAWMAPAARRAQAGSERLEAWQDAADPIPLMAYYYIWFNVESWDRAKSDYPLLGRYSSDDRAVMEQHVAWAQDAGIDGFIVSWKSAYQLDKRLEQLMEVAAGRGFQLWVIYQGLDFERKPLPIAQIDADLEYFIENYAAHPAFGMYEKPVVIWSGTWEFSPQEIESLTSSYRHDLLILSSERNLEGVERLSGLVDGNAYYWSSVNPQTFPGYQEKLDAMGAAVHERGGLWVAPAAPGFDARLLGGETVVERRGGETLRVQMEAAQRSNADVVGLISWNEFSENSHVEPSQKYGAQSLEVLGDIRAGVAPVILDFDSSAPGTTDYRNYLTIVILAGVLFFIIGSLAVIVIRPLQRRQKAEF